MRQHVSTIEPVYIILLNRISVFSIVGFTNATAVAITVSGTNFIFSIVNLLLVDKFGRRIILAVTVLGMSICMLIAAVSFHYIPIDKNLVLQSNEVGWPGTLVLVTIICYVACFSAGVATIAWIGTELIPLEVRAVGTMLVRLLLSMLSNDHVLTRRSKEYSNLLGNQHHHCVDIPVHDERNDSEWSLRLLLWYLFHRLDFHRILLP